MTQKITVPLRLFFIQAVAFLIPWNENRKVIILGFITILLSYYQLQGGLSLNVNGRERKMKAQTATSTHRFIELEECKKRLI